MKHPVQPVQRFPESSAKKMLKMPPTGPTGPTGPTFSLSLPHRVKVKTHKYSVHKGNVGPAGPPLQPTVVEYVTWTVTLEGLLEILAEWHGVQRVWVELVPEADLKPDYSGPRRLRVLAIESKGPVEE